MSSDEGKSFAEMLACLVDDLTVICGRCSGSLEGVVFGNGKRRLMILQMTYRDNTRYIDEPTDGEIETVVAGDMWSLWNSERSEWLWGLYDE